MAEHVSSLEARNAELSKKYEEYKKSYYKVRDEREKLKADIANVNEQK
jgi:predicted RNase H-like nuclease (RuvC/YqgF family)